LTILLIISDREEVIEDLTYIVSVRPGLKHFQIKISNLLYFALNIKIFNKQFDVIYFYFSFLSVHLLEDLEI